MHGFEVIQRLSGANYGYDSGYLSPIRTKLNSGAWRDCLRLGERYSPNDGQSTKLPSALQTTRK